MNEYTADRLRQELRDDVERRYAGTEREWADAGCTVRRHISVQEKKDGRHTGEALFFVTSASGTREYTALYNYVLQAHGKPAHWHMNHDWRD